MPEAISRLEIVGAGRAGLALGSALLEVGAVARLVITGRRPTPPDHPLFRGGSQRADYHHGIARRADPPDAVLLAVPDGSIAAVAAELATSGLPTFTPVLHLSGAFGSDLLEPLARVGHPTGSLHPLVALSDPEAASRLRGGWFALEGAPRAVSVGEELVAALGGRVLRVDGAGKPLYHGAAVAASNLVVALLGVAEGWMARAGVPRDEARAALAELASGAVESVRRRGSMEALTGPVARGDVTTIRAHLARLSPADRDLYSVLSLSALTLARQRGLDPDAADQLARVLQSAE